MLGLGVTVWESIAYWGRGGGVKMLKGAFVGYAVEGQCCRTLLKNTFRNI